MQRHEAGFTELSTANRQHPRFQIDILKFKVACFAQAKAGDAQQAEQTMIDPRPQFASLPATGHL
jgi:hypothetical protein